MLPLRAAHPRDLLWEAQAGWDTRSARWDGFPGTGWLFLSNQFLIGHGIFRQLQVLWVSFAVIGYLGIRGPSFPLRGCVHASGLENIPDFSCSEADPFHAAPGALQDT